MTRRRGIDPYVVVAGLVKRFGDHAALDGVSFVAQQGEMLTLLGPSGCGKTTLLRCIAGLEQPDDGEISIGGRVVLSARRGLSVPPEHRGIGMVFQSYAIWPHMTVFQNVAYPLTVRKLPRPVIRDKVEAVLELVGLAGMEDRNATMLSGGQQQRVALARSLVGDPALVLFDEPLSNLDATLRESMRAEILRLQRAVGKSAIYVTHDQEEAMAISDHLVVLDRGRIVQEGDARALYERPANPFVAGFIGSTNLIPVKTVAGGGGVVEVEIVGGAVERRPRLRLSADGTPPPAGMMSVRPEQIRLHRTPPADPQNSLEALVTQVVYLGHHLDCRLAVAGCESVILRVRGPVEDAWAVGDRVHAELPVAACRLVPDETH